MKRKREEDFGFITILNFERVVFLAKKVSGADDVVKTFSKSQILSASKYKHMGDLLSVLLQDDKEYSKDEVDTLIEKFMKGKVI